MKKLFLISASILSLTACVSTELSNQNQPYDASKDARIRLYGQNGRPSYLTVNIDGTKEIRDINMEFNAHYVREDLDEKSKRSCPMQIKQLYGKLTDLEYTGNNKIAGEG